MILLGLISFNASDEGSITFGCAKSRLIVKFFIEARKTCWKTSEKSISTEYPGSIILSLNKTVLIFHYTCQLRREVKNYLEGEAMKKLEYRNYPSGWKVFQKF